MPSRQSGQVLIISIIFLTVMLVLMGALLGFVGQNVLATRKSVAREQAIQLADAGIDKAIWQLNQTAGSYTGETGTVLGAGTMNISVADISGSVKEITATAYVPNSASPRATRKVKVQVSIDTTTVSFNYAVQAGNGGFTLDNSSRITGNVFSDGPVIGYSQNNISGSAVSTGAAGWIYGVLTGGSAYAHTIGKTRPSTTVGGDAHYVTKVNTTVAGTSYPGSPDQSSVPLPISDSQINAWETEAAGGGEITTCDSHGDHNITSNITLGPKKISCNLVIKNATLTVTGHLWVTGNITTQTGSKIKIDPSLGNTNVVIVADKPGNTTGSGIITTGQQSTFEGSGGANSFVFLISQNNSEETVPGNTTAAVVMSQGSSALVAYASHGLVSMNQSVGVKSVTGYKISLQQSANVTYDSGLPSTLFQSGPGGSWTVIRGTWREVK